MFTVNDIINIILPVPSHWMIWLGFLIVVVAALLLYAYPYLKNKKEFHYQHVGIPVAAVISVYIFAKMLEGVLYQGAILKVDAWLGEAVLALSSSWIINLASFITTFGGTLIITLLFAVALVVLLLRKRWRYAILSTVAILGATGLQLIIKELVQRVRPVNLIETGFSFPSGHAISAIVFVSLIIYSFKDDFKRKTVKWVLIIAASAFFTAVAISRIILHVHWFSDVVAGMSLGLFWFMLLVLIERAIPGLVPAVKVETKEAKPISKTVPVIAVKNVLKK